MNQNICFIFKSYVELAVFPAAVEVAFFKLADDDKLGLLPPAPVDDVLLVRVDGARATEAVFERDDVDCRRLNRIFKKNQS